jgi:hypothetical protein
MTEAKTKRAPPRRAGSEIPFPLDTGRRFTEGAIKGLFDARHVERRPPATLGVLRELKVKPLPIHTYGHVADACPVTPPAAEDSPLVHISSKGGDDQRGGERRAATRITHWMFSSARARSDGGMVRPIALGKAFGYTNVHKTTPTRHVVRTINPEQAAVVVKIFAEDGTPDGSAIMG